MVYLRPGHLWLPVLICLCIVADAAELPPVNRLGISHGLSNNSVRTVLQDQRGFIWFGTYDGLNRYDGREFRIFRNRLNDTNSLPHNYIYSLHEDRFRNLWVGTGQGVVRYDHITGSFKPLLIRATNAMHPEKITVSANSILSDDKGNLMLSTIGWGFLVKRVGEDFAHQVPVVTASGEKSDCHVRSLCFVSGKAWLFVEDIGVCYYDAVAGKVVPVNKERRTANSIIPDGRDGIWLGTDDGLYHYSISSNRFLQHYVERIGELTANEVLSLCFDAHGRLWVGTDGGGVNILDTSKSSFSYIRPGHGRYNLSSESVYSIISDSESRMWLGLRQGGCNILDEYKSPFVTVSSEPDQPDALSSNFIYSFCQDRDGQILIGTDGAGVSIWNRTANTFRNYRHQVGDNGSLSHNNVTSICKDHTGTIWVGTFGGGVNRFDRQSGRFSVFPCINELTGAEDKKVSILYEDGQKTFWAATFSNGKLYRFDRKRNRFMIFDQSIYDINCMAEDGYGDLWAGNSHNLIKLDRDKRVHKFFKMGKPVRAIYEDRARNFWVGTEGGGLILFDIRKGEIIKRFSEADGLCNNSVLNIKEDEQGNLWLSTFNGLSRFDPEKKQFRNFFESDGLQSNQFYFKSAIKLSSGELMFGGINGFNIFDPARIRVRNFTPPVHITSIMVNNRPIHEVSAYIGKADHSVVSELQIPYAEAVLSFGFNALEYSSPEKIQYAYYLQGWDKDWNYISNVRNINYNNIREGSYTLRIRNTNANGDWNKTEAMLRIIILPPWYRSWWALSLYLIMAGTAVYFYLNYRAQQADLRYKVKLAAIDAEKEKEINEKRQSFFTNISHEFRTPLTLIINPLKDLVDRDPVGGDRDALNFVYRNAKRLLSLVDQLLLFRKTESETGTMKLAMLNFRELCQDTYLNFSQMAKSRGITYLFECPETDIIVVGDREKLEIIFYNLLSNAFKYTPDHGRISFCVTEDQESVHAVVADTGQGISEDAGQRLFEKFYQSSEKGKTSRKGFGIGLYLVKKLMDEHKGSVSFSSKSGQGSEFSLTFRKGRAHFGDAELSGLAETGSGSLLSEIREGDMVPAVQEGQQTDPGKFATVISEVPSMLIVDDNHQMRKYLAQIFQNDFRIYEGINGNEGISIAKQMQPDIIISDVVMEEMTGIEFCRSVKESPVLNHIPFILITGSFSPESKLKGIEYGADDYVTKPFEKDLLIARVHSLVRKQQDLRKYFYNEITHQQHTLTISGEYKEFLDRCIAIVESHIDHDDFNIQMLASEIGMSHSKLYKKIKTISGQSANAFIRFIRLRKAAELFINTDHNISQTAFNVGINDVKYFRDQFTRTFGMKPSEYIKKYRKTLGKNYKLNSSLLRDDRS